MAFELDGGGLTGRQAIVVWLPVPRSRERVIGFIRGKVRAG